MTTLDLTSQTGPARPATALSDLERRLLDAYQRGFPLSQRPYAEIAEQLGTSEAEVIAALERLSEAGVVSRVGAVVTPHKVGWSTLAAMAVPAARLTEVAALVSGFPEINHNYERDHHLNLWFVVAAADRKGVQAVLQAIERESGLMVLDLPLVEAYRLDLGFPLAWN